MPVDEGPAVQHQLQRIKLVSRANKEWSFTFPPEYVQIPDRFESRSELTKFLVDNLLLFTNSPLPFKTYNNPTVPRLDRYKGLKAMTERRLKELTLVLKDKELRVAQMEKVQKILQNEIDSARAELVTSSHGHYTSSTSNDEEIKSISLGRDRNDIVDTSSEATSDTWVLLEDLLDGRVVFSRLDYDKHKDRWLLSTRTPN